MNEGHKVKKPMKSKIITARTGLAAVAVLAAASSAVAFKGGGPAGTGAAGYRGPLPAGWFDEQTDPCRTEPITMVTDNLFAVEYQVDVDAVTNDGDPNTFARCVIFANDSTNRCLVGLPDGNVVACTDESAPHALPSDGDMLYVELDFQALAQAEAANWDGSHDPVICNIYVGTNDRFGEADPKCRAGGDGDGDGDGSSAGCNDQNSIVLTKATPTSLVEGQCYKYNHTFGNLQVGSWNQSIFTIDGVDSSSGTFNQQIPTGGYSAVSGVAIGDVYFTVDVQGNTSVTGQVDSF